MEYDGTECNIKITEKIEYDGTQDMKATVSLEFEKELTDLINSHSVENVCDVPDFILAGIICSFIRGIGPHIKETLDWHGCDSVTHPGNINHKLNSSEAIYGFAGWLTCREAQTIMSSKDDAAPIAELVDNFCKTNKLPKPRDHWEKNFKHPD